VRTTQESGVRCAPAEDGRSADVPLARREDPQLRVGGGHLQEHPIQALTGPVPVGGMPSVLPKAHAPHAMSPRTAAMTSAHRRVIGSSAVW
jgi:hypothetical protein